MVEIFIKTSIMNICARKVVCTECTRFKCVSQSGNIFSKAKLRKVVLRTPAGQTTESSIGDKFRFKMQLGRPQCVILSRGRTDPVPLPSFILCMGCRDLLLSLCRSSCQAGTADCKRKWHGNRKETRYLQYLSALLAVSGCFMFFTYWLMEKFVDLANFLSALSCFCPLDFGILSLWLTGLFDFIFGLLQLYLFPFVEDWVVCMKVSSSSWCSSHLFIKKVPLVWSTRTATVGLCPIYAHPQSSQKLTSLTPEVTRLTHLVIIRS